MIDISIPDSRLDAIPETYRRGLEEEIHIYQRIAVESLARAVGDDKILCVAYNSSAAFAELWSHEVRKAIIGKKQLLRGFLWFLFSLAVMAVGLTLGLKYHMDQIGGLINAMGLMVATLVAVPAMWNSRGLGSPERIASRAPMLLYTSVQAARKIWAVGERNLYLADGDDHVIPFGYIGSIEVDGTMVTLKDLIGHDVATMYWTAGATPRELAETIARMASGVHVVDVTAAVTTRSDSTAKTSCGVVMTGGVTSDLI